jgi:hypothetical protein
MHGFLLEVGLVGEIVCAFRPERWPDNRKRPAGEARRFWGYYREERYVSLYMWIDGR